MENSHDKAKKVTVRTAPNFGYQLAGNLGIRLEKENVPPSRWPAKFPITIKQINGLPEVGKNTKVARRIAEAAQAMWQDMRESALEIEKDMKLHPELYDFLEPETDAEPTVWRQLSIEIEQIAGNVFVTEYENEEVAKSNVYKMISAPRLKNCMIEFRDDYKNFIDEVREAIRPKKEILPSERLEMICMLNTNTIAAKRLRKKKPVKTA